MYYFLRFYLNIILVFYYFLCDNVKNWLNDLVQELVHYGFSNRNCEHKCRFKLGRHIQLLHSI